MKGNDHLLILFGFVVGILLGLMGAWMSAPWIGWAADSAPVSNGIGSILGAAIGGALAVVGAVHAAQKQIEANKVESDKKRHIEILQKQAETNLDILASLNDLQHPLFAFVSSFENLKALSRKREMPKNHEITFAIRSFRSSGGRLLAVQAPMTGHHGGGVSRAWRFLVHTVSGLLEEYSGFLNGYIVAEGGEEAPIFLVIQKSQKVFRLIDDYLSNLQEEIRIRTEELVAENAAIEDSLRKIAES